MSSMAGTFMGAVSDKGDPLCVQVSSVLNIPQRLYWSTNHLSLCNIPFHFQRMIPALLLSPDMFTLALRDTLLFSLVSTLSLTHALCTCTTATL